MRQSIKDFFKDYRVIILIVAIFLSIGAISLNGIQQGLDLSGGSLIQIHLEQPVDTATMTTVTTVLEKRLNIYGVKDVKVRPSGNQDVIVEIAGVQPEQVSNVVATPGKFEAKIGNQTALVGSDITTVEPYVVEGTNWRVPFKISAAAANKFAQVANGKANQPVDMYLDDRLISSPTLSPELANGVASTDVQVTGTNQTKEAAEIEAKGLQTVLQSGALPVKVSLAGISSVSAELGSQFRNGALIAGLVALIVISLVIFIRYRTPKLVIPIIFTSLVELLIILGIAAAIKWNIDLAAIAGILAAIGTGVDDQIIITDEVLKGNRDIKEAKTSSKTKKGKKTKGKGKKTKERKVKVSKRITGFRVRIRSAFFIIYASAATLIAAMLPIAYIGFSRGATGIGFLSGFAFTTIIGVLIGIFLTRPVYAKFIELLMQGD
jgi:preprotein translocase subunit SecD